MSVLIVPLAWSYDGCVKLSEVMHICIDCAWNTLLGDLTIHSLAVHVPRRQGCKDAMAELVLAGLAAALSDR